MTPIENMGMSFQPSLCDWKTRPGNPGASTNAGYWMGKESPSQLSVVVFFCFGGVFFGVYFGLSPLPVRVTTRIITFLVGDPYKPSFATVTGRGDNPMYTPFPLEGFVSVVFSMCFLQFVYLATPFRPFPTWLGK